MCSLKKKSTNLIDLKQSNKSKKKFNHELGIVTNN